MSVTNQVVHRSYAMDTLYTLILFQFTTFFSLLQINANIYDNNILFINCLNYLNINIFVSIVFNDCNFVNQ